MMQALPRTGVHRERIHDDQRWPYSSPAPPLASKIAMYGWSTREKVDTRTSA